MSPQPGQPAVCPAGHASASTDYCDTCGLPIAAPATGAPSVAGSSALGGAAAASPTPAAGAAAALVCPHCGTDNLADALFCENCGYDFTTGTPPREETPEPEPVASPDAVGAPLPSTGGSGAGTAPATAGPASPAPSVDLEWVVEVWVDPDWYAAQGSTDPCPSSGLPAVVGLRERSLLVGRASASRNIHPQIDISVDPGVSRRHAQLSTDGQRWFVEDLQSANGTFVGSAGAPLPDQPLEPGIKHELDADDRLYLGAWSRIVLREATPEEKGGPAA